MDTLAFLGDLAPAFAVRGCQVKILTEPSQFYKELCTRARHSKVRISMAALYLGSIYSTLNIASTSIKKVVIV